nr:unnamed protein product [Callosobruchus analis]
MDVIRDERDLRNNTNGSIVLTCEAEELDANGIESNPGIQVLYINDGDTTSDCSESLKCLSRSLLVLMSNILLMM